MISYNLCPGIGISHTAGAKALLHLNFTQFKQFHWLSFISIWLSICRIIFPLSKDRVQEFIDRSSRSNSTCVGWSVQWHLTYWPSRIVLVCVVFGLSDSITSPEEILWSFYNQTFIYFRHKTLKLGSHIGQGDWSISLSGNLQIWIIWHFRG